MAAKYARTPELALKQLRGEKADGGGGLVVFANVGEAPPVQPNQPIPPISVAFKPMTGPDALAVKGPVVGVVATDVDGDLDLDLLVLVDGQPPITILNDRMLRFHRGEHIIPNGASWGGGFVLDANGDDQPDLVLVEAGAAPRVLVSKRDTPAESLATRFAAGNTDSPALRSAAWCDLDLDGRTDVVGLSADRKPVFLQGDGSGKFSRKSMPFGPEADAIPDLLAVTACDLDGDGNPDLLAWSATGGLRVFRSSETATAGCVWCFPEARPSAGRRREQAPPTNADGVGCWVRLHVGSLSPAAENTTLFAGLGQSRMPLHLGIGKADAAEVVRVRWPDAVIQAELNQVAGVITIAEHNRKPVSCPVLFAWDGERFATSPTSSVPGRWARTAPTAPPAPAAGESVKIEPHQLAPRNGKYILKVAEPMDEVMYLDRLRLDVIDHPADMSIFPDERFATSDPQPTQERLFFRDSERVFPAKAIDHRGRDVTATVRERDGRHYDAFAKRAWLGYAEEHYLQLDFGAALKSLPAGRKVYLVLAGWVDYPYPESIYAATQAGVPTIMPVLEQQQPDGKWKLLGEVGFPAGLTRVMTRDVTGWIDPAGGPGAPPHELAGVLGPDLPRAGRADRRSRAGTAGVARRSNTVGSCRSTARREAAHRV